jgi:hypothetical protein
MEVECGAMSEDKQLNIAISALITSPHFLALEDTIRERREQWISDTRGQPIYQNHAELTHVMARVAECDWLLELFDDCRKRISAEPAKSS